jgi:3-deoxy-D-manno-octulosonic acid (KDO) 8-phosphate synthase
VEVHPHPDKAWSDADQTLDFAMFDEMMASLDPYLALRRVPARGREAADVSVMEAVG